MDTYVIITSPDCKWCDRAKDALRKRDLPYYEFDTTEKNIRHLFFSLGMKTVPQIFKAAYGNNPIEYIGGYDDLAKRLAYEEFKAVTNSH